jgi:hypothetical protein
MSDISQFGDIGPLGGMTEVTMYYYYVDASILLTPPRPPLKGRARAVAHLTGPSMGMLLHSDIWIVSETSLTQHWEFT